MFQEELERRDLKVVELQEQVSKMERESRQRGSDLAAERNRSDDLQQRVVNLEADKLNLINQLADSRRGAEKAAETARKLAEAETKAQTAMEHVRNLSAQVEEMRSHAEEGQRELAASRADTLSLQRQLTPMIPLLAAVSEVNAALKVISAELGKLEGDG